MGIDRSDLLESSVALHRDLLVRLEREYAEMGQRIADVKGHIQRLESEGRKTSRSSGNGTVRRRKGENARAISELFADPSIALSKQEIADRTHVPFSSVLRVLERDSRYVQGEDGLWRRKGQ